MITIRRTDSEDPDFIEPVKLLDMDPAVCDGNEHSFYHQRNGYVITENYGQYCGIENSICFEKKLNKPPKDD